VSAIEPPAMSPMVTSSATKVISNCRIWVARCLKRFGSSSAKYGQCLRNHGCG
jgi:hypothetical protein